MAQTGGQDKMDTGPLIHRNLQVWVYPPAPRGSAGPEVRAGEASGQEKVAFSRAEPVGPSVWPPGLWPSLLGGDRWSPCWPPATRRRGGLAVWGGEPACPPTPGTPEPSPLVPAGPEQSVPSRPQPCTASAFPSERLTLRSASISHPCLPRAFTECLLDTRSC